MIRVEVIPESESSGWETLIGECGGHALHLPAVHLAYHRADDLRRLRFEQNGRAIACALAAETRTRRLGLSLLGGRVLLLPTAPAVAEGGSADEVWSALLDFARDVGYERIEVQPAYGRCLPGEGELARFRTGGIVEFVLDLRGGEETVYAAMHKVHRKNMRKAAKAGLRVEQDRTVDGLLRLREVQGASSDRAREKAEGFAVPDEDFFLSLHRNVYADGPGRLLLAYQDDRVVAALAWLEAAGRAQTVRSGSLPEGYRSRAMYLLHDVLIQGALSAGVKELNIGGVPEGASQPDHPQAGLYEFKSGFGGEACVRYGLSIPLAEVGR